jgi:hypothetical protein
MNSPSETLNPTSSPRNDSPQPGRVAREIENGGLHVEKRADRGEKSERSSVNSPREDVDLDDEGMNLDDESVRRR